MYICVVGYEILSVCGCKVVAVVVVRGVDVGAAARAWAVFRPAYARVSVHVLCAQLVDA